MTDTWHTRTESKPVHITSQNRSSYPRIHPELHRKCRQHSGKQRADFVQWLLLLAHGSTVEIKGPRLDIIHNFDENRVSVGCCRGTGSGISAFARVRQYPTSSLKPLPLPSLHNSFTPN